MTNCKKCNNDLSSLEEEGKTSITQYRTIPGDINLPTHHEWVEHIKCPKCGHITTIENGDA